uniref:Large ribosomal subunit protein eL20 n=1 Tax=Fervidicoccus fontis TaxID=683846 RepID=A0A7J3ZJ60_9CREN
MVSVKLFRISGRMLVSHDRMPEWRKFTVELRAVSVKDALERVYSELGSRHKLRRKHIRVERIEELPPDEAVSRDLAELSRLQGFVLYD